MSDSEKMLTLDNIRDYNQNLVEHINIWFSDPPRFQSELFLVSELTKEGMANQALKKENEILRVMASRVECIHGHRNENNVCDLGYPGCICADDMMVACHMIEDSVVQQKQNAVSKLSTVEAENKKILTVLKDFALNGIRVDLAPTELGKPRRIKWWQDYLIAADNSVRTKASAVLVECGE